MQFTAQEICLMLNGTVEGDPLATVNHLAKIEEASAGSLVLFCKSEIRAVPVQYRCLGSHHQ